MKSPINSFSLVLGFWLDIFLGGGSLLAMADKKKGFTLVELSIVLVIIGLLIGGILAAQSMISTAKINSVAMQIGQFDAGVENFKTKYNALPGDAKSFGGDGDGLIDISSNCVYGYGNYIFACEIANFWADIFPEQYKTTNGGQYGVQAVYNGANKNVPLSKLGSSNAFFIASAIANGVGYQTPADPTNPQNFYAIFDGSQLQTTVYGFWGFAQTTATNSAFKPVDLLALDKKIDDGVANTGNVISGMIAYNGFAGIQAYTGTTMCNNGGNYLLGTGHTGYECTPLIRIGASAGDPQ